MRHAGNSDEGIYPDVTNYAVTIPNGTLPKLDLNHGFLISPTCMPFQNKDRTLHPKNP